MNTPIRVLIVEDSQDDTTLLLLELESGGYDPICERIETATAMQKPLAWQPWDIIIADYPMPHFNATGPGLSVSARLIRAQGGHISVTSLEGKGSVFTVFLPAVAAYGEVSPG